MDFTLRVSAGGCASAGGTGGRAGAAQGATAGQSTGLVLRVSCAQALRLPTWRRVSSPRSLDCACGRCRRGSPATRGGSSRYAHVHVVQQRACQPASMPAVSCRSSTPSPPPAGYRCPLFRAQPSSASSAFARPICLRPFQVPPTLLVAIELSGCGCWHPCPSCAPCASSTHFAAPPLSGATQSRCASAARSYRLL